MLRPPLHSETSDLTSTQHTTQLHTVEQMLRNIYMQLRAKPGLYNHVYKPQGPGRGRRFYGADGLQRLQLNSG